MFYHISFIKKDSKLIMVDIKSNSVPTFNELVEFISQMPSIDAKAVSLVRQRNEVNRKMNPTGCCCSQVGQAVDDLL